MSGTKIVDADIKRTHINLKGTSYIPIGENATISESIAVSIYELNLYFTDNLTIKASHILSNYTNFNHLFNNTIITVQNALDFIDDNVIPYIGAYKDINFGVNNLIVGKSITVSDQLISNIVTGTPPFIVISSTLVSNLNADSLDNLHASSFQLANNFNVTGISKYALMYYNEVTLKPDLVSSTDININGGIW